MRGKVMLLVGFGVGYVLGARAGRRRYEQIVRGWRGFWHSPGVQHQVKNIEDFARDKAPDVVDFLGEAAKKVVSRGEASKLASDSSRSSTSKGTSSTSTRSSSNSKDTSSSTSKSSTASKSDAGSGGDNG